MTKRTTRGTRVRSPLTALESEVMQAVWGQERSSVESVHQAVSRKRRLKETSVRTILRRLEQKGYLRHEEQGRAYIYQAAERPSSLAARAVRHIIDSFCRGSIEELVSGMVDAEVLSKAELARLQQFVRARKQKGK